MKRNRKKKRKMNMISESERMIVEDEFAHRPLITVRELIILVIAAVLIIVGALILRGAQ